MKLINDPSLILPGILYIILYFILFFFAKWLKGLMAKFNMDEELTHNDNYAICTSMVGYFIGMTVIYVGALSGDGKGLWEDVLEVAAYALGGILLLNLSRIINDKVILFKFSVHKELVEDQNVGTGVVEAATYIASGLVIAGAISGEGGGPLAALVFYAIGQLCLIIFSLIYDRLSPYPVHDEIEKDNIAAGLGFAGGIISIGIILMRAVSGDFQGWVEDLTTVGLDVLIIFVYLMGVRLVFDRFILRNSNLTTEIVQDRNLGAGLLEMFVSICFSVVLAFII